MDKNIDNIIKKYSNRIGLGTDDVDEILELVKEKMNTGLNRKYWLSDDFGDFSNHTYMYDNNTYF